MKNTYVIPTDKPSRLGYLTKKGKEVYKDLRLFDRLMPNILDSENQHIYITDNSEIKNGDWHLVWLEGKWEVLNYMPSIGYRKECLGKEVCKIILTTDQDLIKECIQSIDDEFLEWFVKNPSCEEVDVEESNLLNTSRTYLGVDKYKIIIPKEEAKKHVEFINNNIDQLDKATGKSSIDVFKEAHIRDFIAGAKWQAERMYSEKDLKTAWEESESNYSGLEFSRNRFYEWLEQFKNLEL